MNNNDLALFEHLFSLLIDGEISDEQYAQLKLLLKNNKELRNYYFRLVNIEVVLRDSQIDGLETKDMMLAPEFWEGMAEDAKTAPAVDVPKAKPDQKPDEKVVYPSRKKLKIGWFEILTLVNAAAVILFVIFIKFIPSKTGVEVATVIDSIDAQWSENASDFQSGSRLVTGKDEFSLREGFVKILFDNSAKVLVEAPAMFRVVSDDHVKLSYGKIYSKVPPEAIGFTVSTSSSEIVDLGTEFGVEVDYSGDTLLHVIKGKTSLSSRDKMHKAGILVNAGNAKKVSESTYAISDIACDDVRFVRDIDSANKLVWRGEPAEEPDGLAKSVKLSQWNGYIDWDVEIGSWGDGANWNAKVKPDATWSIKLRKNSAVCTLNTKENPINNNLEVYNGQTLNIIEGGSMGCGWSRFGWSTVNMTGNGTWLLNNENLVIGHENKNDGPCVWTMSGQSRIDTINKFAARDCLCIAENNGIGQLRIIGSGVTINCAQFYMGRAREQKYSPSSTIEFVMDEKGASTVHVSYLISLSEKDANSHLLLSSSKPLPQKDIVLIENTGSQIGIGGDGAFDTMNQGPASEGTDIAIGGHQYKLTYHYAASLDGIPNDIALVFQK